MLMTVMLGLISGLAAPAQADEIRTGLSPKIIPLPNGFRPEGISTGRGTASTWGRLRTARSTAAA